MRVVARGTLAYAAAWHGERLVTIELTERFELVVRDGPALRASARIDLGPPELDLRALAVAGDVALVGGDDGWIRRIDLATHREVDRWPQGAPITALAADASYVVAGDASGVICLRRASGELLQCATTTVAATAAAPIDAVVIEGDQLEVLTGRHPRRLGLPSLRSVPGAPPVVAWRGGTVRRGAHVVRWAGPHGDRTLASLAGPVRAIAMSPAGKLAIAGWVRRLDQPSVIVWSAPPR